MGRKEIQQQNPFGDKPTQQSRPENELKWKIVWIVAGLYAVIFSGLITWYLPKELSQLRESANADTTRQLQPVHDSLSRIEGQLKSLQLVEAAENPTTATNQQAAVEIVQDARKLKSSIPVDVVKDVGQSFIAASGGNAGAWKAATALVNYRSYLSSLTFPVPDTGILPEDTEFAFKYPKGEAPAAGCVC